MDIPKPSHTQYDIALIWSKGTVVTGVDPNIRRKDICGAWIDWAAYGNRNSPFGWEIDHMQPISKGGAHHISNLHPLHWQNNARKSDGSLVCAIVARN